ncbi:MAG: bifunctional SulP family inorganic anion transporter/carbonic anhydrase [Pirellulales bacterium]|nr:bifunctional SulP family inorganic anion transporter/carbonic anhydrase [Pirellulales bacterium]
MNTSHSDNSVSMLNPKVVGKDLVSGVVVFLVALPLCLGIALASGAPLISGLIAGIAGGLVVGILSGSHTSVSGPAAGLTAIVAAQITALESFEAFLVAVIFAGVIQIVLGLLKAGGLNAFFPSSVIKGLLAAIGVILILKQIPHLVGHDSDPEGAMSFQQPDAETNTFTELLNVFGDLQLGSLVIGLGSVVLLLVWDRIKPLKRSLVPAPLIVVALGVGLGSWFGQVGGRWVIGASHMVEVPVSESLSGFFSSLASPDFSAVLNPAVYLAAVTIAIVASLETLLNLEAVDRLDPRHRHSPPNRELIAQGVGNITAGMLGGLPMTSVIVRSSVNISTGAYTRISAIFHGLLLVVSVIMFPAWLNMIPLSCLAAILIVTGFKLASPKLFVQMWKGGRYQFIPFVTTVSVIVLRDLLVGIMVGLGVSLTFILMSNLRRPVRKVVEGHVGGEVVRIELGNQVSFLNKAALERSLREVPDGGHVLLDAHGSDYIDPDVLSLIREFKEEVGPARNVQVSLRGFRDKYELEDEVLFVDYTTRELQQQLTPAKALQFLMDGNERFRSGKRLSRDLGRQLRATSHGQHPMAVILSCIDSRTPAEVIFDLGLGDVLSVRVAGNLISPMILGSIEYGCKVAGAKLVMVLGNTQCGVVATACEHAAAKKDLSQDGSANVASVIHEIQASIDGAECHSAMQGSKNEQAEFVNGVATNNVQHVVDSILEQSSTIKQMTEEGEVAVVGGMYDVSTGKIDFFVENGLVNEEEVDAMA